MSSLFYFKTKFNRAVELAPTPLDKEIILALSTHIPLIVLPRQHGPQSGLGGSSSNPSHSAKLSSFRPASAVALRSGLFHSPETVALLRSEAADRFMKWREVERAVEGIWEVSQSMTLGKGKRPASGLTGGTVKSRRRLAQAEMARLRSDAIEGIESDSAWSKARWEAEWMETHSRDVAIRARENFSRRRASTLTVNEGGSTRNDLRGHAHVPFDPLHLPSLLLFSISLVGPLRSRVNESIRAMLESLAEGRVQLALVGGFCLGLGVGVWGKVR